MCQLSAWSLDIPTVVLDGRTTDTKAISVTVGTINSALTVSHGADHPLIRQWMELIPDRGAEAAIEEMLNNDEIGAEFAEAYEELRTERKERGTAIWTIADSTDFVMRSKDAFDRREISCVAIMPPELGDEEASHRCATFCWRPKS